MGDREVAVQVQKWLPVVLKPLEKTRIVRGKLLRTFRAAEALEDTVLTDNHLKKLGIKLSSLDLEADDRDGNITRFYQPIPKTELPAMDWNKVDFWEWEEGYAEESRRVDHNLDEVIHQVRWGLFPDSIGKRTWVHCGENPVFGRAEFPPMAPYEWVAFNEAKVNSTGIPHFRFTVTHHTEPVESLRRSEMLPIVAHMDNRMSQGGYFRNYYFPVLVLSIFRSKARILQAYHDGTHLQISMSRFYDFKEDDRNSYELFARWLWGKPCADTLAPLPIQGRRVDNQTVKKIASFLEGSFAAR